MFGYVVKNKSSNCTGLSGVNLLLNNWWVMFRYYGRQYGWFTDWRKASGWSYLTKRHYIKNIMKAVVVGWFHPNGIVNCKIEKGTR
jgi:hypothetical protein